MENKDQHFEDTAHAESFGGGFGDPPAETKPKAPAKKKEAPAEAPASEVKP